MSRIYKKKNLFSGRLEIGIALTLCLILRRSVARNRETSTGKDMQKNKLLKHYRKRYIFMIFDNSLTATFSLQTQVRICLLSQRMWHPLVEFKNEPNINFQNLTYLFRLNLRFCFSIMTNTPTALMSEGSPEHILSLL